MGCSDGTDKSRSKTLDNRLIEIAENHVSVTRHFGRRKKTIHSRPIIHISAIGGAFSRKNEVRQGALRAFDKAV